MMDGAIALRSQKDRQKVSRVMPLEEEGCVLAEKKREDRTIKERMRDSGSKCLRRRARGRIGALGTGKGTVVLDASVDGAMVGVVKMRGDEGASAEVHLVGGLAFEAVMRDHGVVLLDVESDQAVYGGDVDELVKEKPLVFE